MYYREVELEEGVLVQFVGTHVVAYPYDSGVEPTIGFVEDDDIEAELAQARAWAKAWKGAARQHRWESGQEREMRFASDDWWAKTAQKLHVQSTAKDARIAELEAELIKQQQYAAAQIHRLEEALAKADDKMGKAFKVLNRMTKWYALLLNDVYPTDQEWAETNDILTQARALLEDAE